MAKTKAKAAKTVKTTVKVKVASKSHAKEKAVSAGKGKAVKAPPAKGLASKMISKMAEKVSSVAKVAAVAKAVSVVKAVSKGKTAPLKETKKNLADSRKISSDEPKTILESQPALNESAEKKSKKKADKPSKKSNSDVAINLGKDDVNPMWYDFYKKNAGQEPSQYDMRAQFEANQPLMHKTLGWGWIVSNENDRLEVIFKDGKRMLISNYKPS
jgi:hypothetical protein